MALCAGATLGPLAGYLFAMTPLVLVGAACALLSLVVGSVEIQRP